MCFLEKKFDAKKIEFFFKFKLNFKFQKCEFFFCKTLVLFNFNIIFIHIFLYTICQQAIFFQ